MTVSTIPALITENARVRPAESALRFENNAATWHELDRRSNRVTNGLLSEGLHKGARIGYLGKNNDLFFDVLYGSSKAGCVLVPLNWRLAAREIAFIVNDGNIEVLFVDTQFYEVVHALIENGTIECQLIIIENDEFDLAADDASSLTFMTDWQNQYTDNAAEVECSETDTILQLYTSGTTGNPKGAEISSRYFFEAIKMASAAEESAYQWEPEDVVLSAGPLFHISAINWCITAAFYGCETYLLRDFRPREVLHLVDTKPVRLLSGVPAMIQLLLDEPAIETTDFSSLRYFLYGGAPLTPAVLRQAMAKMNCKFAQMYGMTESTMVTYLPPSAHKPEGDQRMLSVGKALPGVTLSIVDEQGKALATGEIGEIVIRSPSLLTSYWNRPGTKIKSGAWFHTGDAGYVDADGYVFLKDRVKDTIISGGENIYPAEVELALHEHPDIREISVIGVTDKKWGEVPMAIVVINDNASIDIEDLKEYSADRLANYKIPKTMQIVSELPRTASGKVLRRKLRDQYG